MENNLDVLAGGVVIERFDQEALSALDLRAYNDGRNPYSETDNSLDNAFVRGIDFYRGYVQKRVMAAGHGRVLDLLCGFGRWTPFLAECNDEVVGLDVLKGCTRIAGGVCRDLGLDNVELLTGDVSLAHSFPDEHFDFVWIWSGLQYVHRGRTLAEVFRLLKPSGRVFVGAYNGPGLMLDHVIQGATGSGINTGSSQWALSALVHGEMWNGNPNFMSPEGARILLPMFGFEGTAVSEEGGLSLSEADGIRKGFKGRKNELGLPKTVEIVATKAAEPATGAETMLAMLRGTPDEQAMARTMLHEEGPFSNDLIVEWLGHKDVYVQQNVQQALLARGVEAVPVLVAALLSGNIRASAGGAMGLTEMGPAAAGGLLDSYRELEDDDERRRIEEVLGEIFDDDSSLIVSLARSGTGARLSSPRLLVRILGSRLRRIGAGVYRRISARFRQPSH